MFNLKKLEKKFKKEYKKNRYKNINKTIVIKSGIVTGLFGFNKNFEKENNFIKLLWEQFYYFFKFFFTKISNIIYFWFSFLIIGLGYNYSFYRGDIIEFFLFLIFVLNFLIELYWSYKVNKWKKSYLKKNYDVFKINKKIPFDLIQNINIDDIKIGNIIKLKFNDESPCDLLLLAADQIIKENYYCFIDNSSNNENIKLSKIKAIQITRQKNCDLNEKINFKNWIKPLNFKIEFKLNENNYQKFKAEVKAKNDPKPEYCDNKNLIPKGSILKSKWIYGLCLNNENENFHIQKKEKSYLKIIKLVEFYSLIMMIILVMVMILQFLGLIFLRTSVNFLDIFDSKAKNALRSFSILIVNIPFLPFGLYFGIDILNFVYAKIIQRKYEKSKDNFLKIINKDVLINLGNIKEVCLSKTNILSENKLIIDNIFINFKIYKFENYDLILEKNNKINKNKFKLEEVNNIIEKNEVNKKVNFTKSNTQNYENTISINENEEKKLNINLSIKNNWKNISNKKKHSVFKVGINLKENINIKDENNFKMDCFKDQNILDLLKSFLLCNNISLENINEEIINKNIDINDIYETTQLKLAEFTNYRISLKLPTFNEDECIYKIQLKLNKKIESYDIIFYNFSDKKDKEIYTVIVKDPNSIYTLYSRINPKIAQDIISFNPNIYEHYNKRLIYNLDEGLNSFVYGKKLLNDNEAEFIVNKYKSIKNKNFNKNNLYKNLSKEFENNLDFIALVGFKEKINKNAINLIKEFKSNQIKINLLTSDNFLNASQVAYNYQLINKNEDSFFYDFNTINLGKISIKNTLEEIKKLKDVLKNKNINNNEEEEEGSDKNIFLSNYNHINDNKKKKNYVIFNNNNSDKTLIKQSQIKKLTKFNLIISGLSISIIIKNSFLYYHFIFILKFCKCIIGFNMNDKEKGILTEIIKKDCENNSILAIGSGANDNIMMKHSDISIQYNRNNKEIKGDIVLNNLENLKKLMYEDTIKLNINLKNFIQHSFFMNIMYWISTVFYNWFCYFSGVTIFDSFMLIVSNLIMNCIMIWIYCIWEDYYNIKLRNKFSALYSENIHFSKKFLKKFYMLLLEAFILSGINSSIFIFIGFTIIKNGLVPNFHTLTILLHISIFIICNLRIYIHSKNIKIIVFLSIFINVGFLIFFIFIYHFFTYELLTFYFFESINIGLIILVIFVIIINFLIIEFSHLLFTLNIEFPLFNQIKDSIKGKYLNSITNSKLILDLNIRISFSQILKNTFKNNSEISSLIDKLINYFDIKNKDDYINIYTLKFKNFNLEKKFNIYNKNKNQQHLLNFLFFLSILFFEVLSTITSINFKIINIWINLTIPILILLFNLIQFIKQINKNFDNIFLVFYLFLLCIKIINTYLTRNYNILFPFIWILYFLSIKVINFINFTILLLINFITLLFIIFIPDLIENNTFGFINNILNILIFLVIFIFFKLIVIIIKYNNIKSQKEEFMENQKLKLKSTNSNEMLSLLMPKFVIDKIGANLGSYFENEISDDVGKLTILFCDIIDFDIILSLYKNEIVNIWDFIFRKFDELCIKHGVQKIETVGKTYMAATGIIFVEENLESKLKNINHSKRIIDLAKDMMEVSKTIILKNNSQLILKIGIHYGECMMGVIGYHKPQFSLIGDTVNFTSRHCSTGKANHIMISEQTWIRIKDFDILEKNKYQLEKIHTPMKGKGGEKAPILVYHIFEKKKISLFNQKIIEIINNNSSKEINIENKQKINKLINLKDVIKKKKVKPFAIARFSILLNKLKKDSNNKTTKNSNFLNKKTVTDKLNSSKNSDNLSIEQINFKKEEFFELKNVDFNEIKYKGSLLKLEENIHNKNLLKDMEEKIREFNKKNIKFIIILFFVYYFFMSILIILVTFTIFKILLIYIWVIILRFFGIFNLVYVLYKGFYSKYFNKLILFTIYFLNYLNFIVIFVLYYIIEGELRRISNSVIFFLFIEIIIMSLVSTQTFPINLENYVKYYSSFYLFQNLIVWIILILYSNSNIIVTPTVIRDRIFSLMELILFLFSNYYSSYLIKYFKNRSYIKLYNNINIGKMKNNEIEDFVERLLPKHIQENMNNNNGKLGETYENVTILFADIVGFTNYSSGKTPKEVVKMLSELFKDFDKVCNEMNLYKVCTIGDCYVVMGFLDKNNRKNYGDEAIDVIRLGLKFIEKIAEVRKKINYEGLHMRIGIHTGNIIGGVIGTDVVRFDIYGPEVNIANKMESNGENDKVAVSEDTMKFVLESEEASNFEFIFHNEAKIDSLKKSINSYFVKEI